MRSSLPTALRTSLVALIASLGLLVGAGPAAAATPCWKQLINDWWDGRIDNVYPIHCYQEAIDNAPEDARLYSSLPDDIAAARQQALQQESSGGDDGNTSTNSSGGVIVGGTDGGGTSGGGTSGGSSGGGSGSGSSSGGSAANGRGVPDKGLFGEAFSKVQPENASSLPLPLIVLAGIAFLLVAGGSAGLVARRVQARRVRADNRGLPHAPPRR